MSYADKVFKGMCRDILDNGVSTEGEKVRPVWEDTNESAYTINKFGVVNRYDLRKEFPALNPLKQRGKGCVRRQYGGFYHYYTDGQQLLAFVGDHPCGQYGVAEPG